jgi:hypothetical protein
MDLKQLGALVTVAETGNVTAASGLLKIVLRAFSGQVRLLEEDMGTELFERGRHSMVLTSDGNDLLRVEGRLAKNPSFWTGLVNVIRHFAKVDGVRVPVATESVAKVKFAGNSHLTVVYEYESINGQPVSVAAKRLLASSNVGTRQ